MRRCAYGGQRLCRGHVRVPKVHRDGYMKITLSKNMTKRTAYIHVVVLESFVSHEHVGLQACHKDGNKRNNHYKNLRWDTAKANINDKKLHGTQTMGETHRFAKLSDSDVIAILRDNRPTKDIALDYGVTYQNVYCIKIGKTWKHLQHHG
jgi:hypothetical protein